MIKILLAVFVVVVIFSTTIYTGVLEYFGEMIPLLNDGFFPFVPMEIRIAFFCIIIGVVLYVVKSFTR